MRVSSIFTSVSFFLAGHLCYGQSTIALSKGQKILVTSVNNVSMTQNAMGQEIPVTTATTVNYAVEIKEVSPAVNFSATITGVKLNGEAMGRPLSFDSDKKEDLDGELGVPFKTVLNMPMELTISTSGKAIDTKKATGAGSEAIAALIGDDPTKQLTGELFFVSTAKAVGDVFMDNGDPATPDIKRSVTYTLKEITGTDMKYAFKGTENTKQTKSLQGMSVVVTSESTLAGELVVDAKTGIIKQKKTEAEAKGNSEVMGQTITFTMKQSVITSSK
jgi:hypothetical protein